MSKLKDVDSYIANADTEARQTLEELREIIKSTVPEAEEGISYNVPFYTFHGTHVGISAAKNHVTFGIGADALQSEDRTMLEEKGYKTGKETIQIRYDQAVPTTEITQLLEEKAEEAKKAQ
ncbi:iron chaperone [Natronorubrum sp. DTA28]|uniref:iron chaperone n=1 Tax=Natronorubrum sp. DTA28 TaxID=3447019 RepID=UPI003F85481B